MNETVILAVVLASACVVLVGVAGLDRQSRKEQLGVALGCVMVYAIVLVTRPDALVLSDAAVLVVAIGAAPLLGRSLGSTGAIAAFAITASAVDLISFGGGLTRDRLWTKVQPTPRGHRRWWRSTYVPGGRSRPTTTQRRHRR